MLDPSYLFFRSPMMANTTNALRALSLQRHSGRISYKVVKLSHLCPRAASSATKSFVRGCSSLQRLSGSAPSLLSSLVLKRRAPWAL